MSYPIAKKRTKVFNEFGNIRKDDYYWLNERSNEEVIEYLKAENSYCEDELSDTTELRENLFNEIKSRIKQDEITEAFLYNNWYYYSRYEEGKEYPVYCRKSSPEGEETIMLDGNEMSKGLAFFHIGSWEIADDNNLLAFSVDTVSRRKYDIKFKDLTTGEIIDEGIKNTSGSFCWAADNKTIFYSRRDDSLRPYKIFRHKLGSPAEDDVEVYHETDNTFTTSVYRSKLGKYIIIENQSTTTDECLILDASNAEGDFKIFAKRKRGVEYSIYHQEDRFLIKTNKDALNFKLMQCPLKNTESNYWEEFITHDQNALLEDVEVFKNHLVISKREDGLVKFKIYDKANNQSSIKFDEEDYYSYDISNYEYDYNIFRLAYTSLKTPRSIIDVNLENGKQELKKTDKLAVDYNPENYITERKYALGRDGVKIPVSLVYRKGLKPDANTKLFLYAYGSYGISSESTFRSHRLSLIDRDFIYAIAHIRGGEDLGRQWYEDGKLLKKKNTFYDFIDVGDYLISEKYCSKDTLFAMGGSAGGLLIGAVINMRPDLFKGVIAAVPFVDVVTTMLDESIPLTTGEYDEWGNPNKKEYYDYMLSYSPYDNVEAKDYPAILVTTGLHDSQVQYWEPAKWVAKLRELKTNDNLVLLKTNMDYGHGGASGRFEIHRETALEYAFLLKLCGIYK